MGQPARAGGKLLQIVKREFKGEAVRQLPIFTGRRPDTRFKRDFKAFLAAIGFKLKHFLPDDYVVEKMFPDCLIPRATGYEKLRGQGGLTEELALLWTRRSECFLADALREAHKKGKTLALDGISFIDYADGRPKVNWKKLIFLYETEKLVPLLIKLNDSIDVATVPRILAALRAVVGNIQIVVARAREGCTEITILAPRQEVNNIIARSANRNSIGTALELNETSIPPKGLAVRSSLFDGVVIDLGRSEVPDRFEKAWRRAVRIDSFIRPWRRLRWLASPSVGSSPIARVISESNERAYTADLRGRWMALKADLRMACITWPLFAALSLALTLLALHPLFPFISMSAGIATGLALSLVSAQVCSSALSPIACGAGTIVMCWAFGLAQAFAVGASRSVETLSRTKIDCDFFISITGGIVGLSAPGWLFQIPRTIVVLLLTAIAFAIAASGWFMVQPIKAGAVPKTSRRRLVIGAIAGSAMGAGIGIVRLISIVLNHLGCPQHLAFIVAFTFIGSAIFAFTIQLKRPRLRPDKLVLFAPSYALITCSLCGLAYYQAGDGLGLLALAASNG